MHLPNHITLLRFLLAGMGAATLLVDFPGHFTVAAVLYAVSAVSDLLDGSIARRWHLTSDLGAFMDPLADKVLVFLYFILLTLYGLYPPWLLLAAIARDLLHDGYRNYAASKQIIIGANTFSKAKTALQMTSLLITMAFLTFYEWGMGDGLPAQTIPLSIGLMIAALVCGVIGTLQFTRRNLFLLSSGE